MANNEINTTNKGVSTTNRKHFTYRSAECLNCGQPLDLSDVYCPYCSQLNSTKPLSLKDFLNEFLGSIISYDSRFRHTIKDLLFHPGRITKKYIEGQRVRYANPFRFFLSVSIIYFLLNGIILNFSSDLDIEEIKNDSVNSAITDSEKYEKATDGINYDNGIIKINGQQPKVKAKFEDYFISEDSLSKMGIAQRIFSRFSMYNSFQEDHKEFTTKQALDSLKQEKNSTNIWLYKRALRVEAIQKNPKEYAQYLFSKIPFFLFFLAPIYAFFVWLLYFRSKHKYTEHLIFLFHIFTFLFLVLLIAKLPDLLIGQDILAGLLFTIVGPIYTYKAMRNYYQQSRWKTIIKFVLLNFVFFIVTSFAMMAFFFGTAAIY